MANDTELLQRFAGEGDESAFNELVLRYIDLVYSAAIRKVSGDAQLAKDVSQTVFIALVKKARELSKGVVLGGWLYRHTCFVAAQTVRTESRRRVREEKAAAMNALINEPDPPWEHLAPFLDEAMQRLGRRDRDAIVLRYFERRDLRGVGTGLGVSEEAARKRVLRALEKLRVFFKRRGLNLSTSTLAALIATHAVVATPTGVAASISGAALASAAGGGGTALTLLKIMTMTKLKLGIISAFALAGIATTLIIQHQSILELRQKNRVLVEQNQQFGRLRAEGPLPMEQAQTPQTNSRSEEQVRELLRLRGEVAGLKRQLAEDSKLTARSSESSRQAENGTDPTNRLSNYYPASGWTNLGFASPRETALSFLWALRSEDLSLYGGALGKTNALTQFPVQWGAAMADIKGSYVSNVKPSEEGNPMLEMIHELADGKTEHTWVQFKEVKGSWFISSLTGYPIVVHAVQQTNR